MQLLVFKSNSHGMLELVEQDGLRDDEDELIVPVVLNDAEEREAA